MVHMRNPWANETYTGPWNDSSRQWTEEFKRQVPYSRQNEGKFFMTIEDFKRGFPLATVTYVQDDYVYSYFHRKGASKDSEKFDFKMRGSGEAFVSVDFYNDRMYPYGCSGETTATLTLMKDGRAINTTRVQSMNGFGYLHLKDLDRGSRYTIGVSSLRWGKHSVRDFAVSVYSAEGVVIKDESG